MFTRTRGLPGENFYTQIPQHWIRDHRLTAMEFKVLCFWSSHEVGYRVTIQQTIAEIKEGRDAIYRAVAGLVAHGYIVRIQERGGGGASARGGATKFSSVEYELGPAAYEQTYERRWGRRPGEPLPENQEAVDENSVSAGGTASGLAVSGSPVTGKRDTKKNNSLEDQGEEDQPPPPDVPVGRSGGGGVEPSTDDNPDQLTAARRVLAEVQATTGRRPVVGKLADRLVGKIADRLAAGWSPDDAIEALSGPMPGVEHVYPVLSWRVGDALAGAPPAPRPPRQREPDAPSAQALQAACRSCDPAGWIVNPDTFQPIRRCTHDPARETAA